ncbi:acyl-CoA dehydrogenase family protein [Granulibacter bethesdensis]|uniref:Short-chain acyl-CoA dehydrogenase n=1 Tax=Granulibacter bethesdensis (strain ATCC BAA-1260 / CGDNIH1) TaxID=391165 RepID=Q0BPQ2_GRABC|nr:acyl-CoA dehydrogenase family protein [Granulibacter bethesdensis]ABI63200.1 Short-chain acyl-CoA dehydrogenase [Granulibacter bethesdensis CGDNIH1]AHJ67827.1 Short-chain acyl-CoA dehydrogenase [Granulibacter bethesdensis]APH53078.1 Short-chain acyl-CoA dehydrogenase [Granulibacter bethesdensis]APH60650.1 Short-chain acyl-CoA dehydrogenase [Granulibacter bethesdensis]APH65767.1 Short-chain acyl-CoA dehydrogenase [Granulibacter bethesdensis]
MSALPAALSEWLEQNALALDEGHIDPALLLPRLAQEGLFAVGLAGMEGSAGSTLPEAVEAIASVSSHSLAAGFVFWSHRSFIEYLLQSPNEGLRNRLLPALLRGEEAGATGLSNAMKFLSGLEPLQITAQPEGQGYRLSGRMPWVTNLRVEGFQVAAAIGHADGSGAFIAALSHDAPGLTRSGDLDLLGLRAANTAAITLQETWIDADQIIHPDASVWLPQVRPAFLGLQCGLSIGLARRSLAEALRHEGAARDVLHEPLDTLTARLRDEERALYAGLRTERFLAVPEALFEIRIRLAAIVAEAVGMELQASGGKAYLQPHGSAFARRWREAAFIPVITPSLVQLQDALVRHTRNRGCAA